MTRKGYVRGKAEASSVKQDTYVLEWLICLRIIE